MKDPVFLSSPIYPPFIPSKPSLCTNRDDHLIPLLSLDDFVFKAQLTSLYIQTIHLAYMTKTKTSSHLSLPKKWFHINIGLIMPSKFSISNLTFFDRLSTISKQTNLTRPFFLYHKKLLIIKHKLNFYNTPNHKITFSSFTNTPHRSL